MKNSSKISQKNTDQKKKLHQRFDSIFTERSKWKLYTWLFIGVSLSIMPLFYQTIFVWMAGYPFEISQILPDYVLVAFAITGNLLGMILDSENPKTQKWIPSVALFLALFLMFGTFLSIPAAYSIISNTIKIGLSIFITIYIITIVILGAFLIIKNEKSCK